MKRLDIEKQIELEPKRIEYAKSKLKELNIGLIHESERMIKFIWKDAVITFYPYSGWATGKTIVDGRGIKKLLNQLK